MNLHQPPTPKPLIAWSTSPPNHLNQPSINLLMNLTSPPQPSQPHLPPSPSIFLCYQGTFWARSSTSEVGNGNGTLDGLLSQFLQDIPEEAILKWEKTGCTHNQWRFKEKKTCFGDVTWCKFLWKDFEPGDFFGLGLFVKLFLGFGGDWKIDGKEENGVFLE